MHDLVAREAQIEAANHLRRASNLLSVIFNPSEGDESKRGGLPKFSLARTISRMTHDHLDGFEAEALSESARLAGRPFDPRKVIIPWALFRDLGTSTAGAGGHLVGSGVLDPIEALRPWSVVARAGMTSVDLKNNVTVPKTITNISGIWVAADTGMIAPVTPNVATIAMAAKTGGAALNFSRQLAKQANAEKFSRNALLQVVGRLIDQAVLNGSGAGGAPQGLLNTPGINTSSGASMDYPKIVSMKRQCAEANADDSAIIFIATPAVREMLELRERIVGSGTFIWDADKVASRPGFVTTDLPAATIVCGDFSNILLGLWGGGLEFAINAFDPAGFRTGQVHARVMVTADVAVLHPAAFAARTSIT